MREERDIVDPCGIVALRYEDHFVSFFSYGKVS